MKKSIAILLAITLLFSLAACGAKEDAPETSVPKQTEAAKTKTADDTLEGEKKILTVYFSSANTNSADAVSSATPYVDGTASTEYLAAYIHDTVGGDLVKLTPVKDYPEDYSGAADAAKAERDKDERPQFVPLDVNPEDYDVIFVGYPMWWYTLPMVLYTFFDTYDFSGKTIVPFNTHAGSGDGGTYAEIAEFEPNATVLDGLAVSGNRADKTQDDVNDWLYSLGF